MTQQSMSLCDFCDEFSGGNQNAFTRIYAPVPKSRALFESENFVLVPSLGAIAEGHVLIIPKRHYTALADMPHRQIRELSELSERVRQIVFQSYGPSLLFEHGVRSQGSGGCGIDHAHLHTVPFSHSADPFEILEKKYPFKAVSSIAELNYKAPPNCSYLYYEEVCGRSWIFDVDYMPSQYVRKLLAESIGSQSWDWRNCGREPALLAALVRLSKCFKLDMGGSVESASVPHSSYGAVDAHRV
jgi:diadenosine tetraphosphate (Ap4A) HIT family hydrolase